MFFLWECWHRGYLFSLQGPGLQFTYAENLKNYADNLINLTDWEFANHQWMINLEFVWIKKNHEKNIFWTYFCSLYIEFLGMWIANKSVQFFWKLIWDNMNILRVKSIMNRDPSARMCNRIRVLRGQQIKLVHTVSKSKFWVIYAIMKNFIRIGPIVLVHQESGENNYEKTMSSHK